jgi:DNA-binding NarL/FixJ family response regulator
MNGLAAARILKTIMPAVPIILFSIHANDLLSEAAGEVGIDALVSKTETATLVGHSRNLLKAAQSFSSYIRQ